MQDIAKELGISITTVSFVINGKSDAMGISHATIKKVNDLIKKKGYKPNNAARILRTGKSNTIALIVEDIGNHFFGNIAKIIEIEANKNGYKVFFSSTEGDTETASSLISLMKQSAVDGLIITATKGLENDIEKLIKENIPFVLIDRLVPPIETDYVIIDNFNGAFKLTQHLIDRGYRSIALITISNGMSQMDERKFGYVSALKNISMIDMILEVSLMESKKEIIDKIQDFLKTNINIDALFFATNYLGILGIEAIKLNNLKIGENLALVSFDDNDVFRLITPSITVAAQPIEEIAINAIDLLLKKLKKGKKNTINNSGVIIQPQIIIRESSPFKNRTL